MQKPITSMALLPNTAKDTALSVTRDALSVLKQLGIAIALPDSLRNLLADAAKKNCVFYPDDRLCANVDCVLVLGGDGSVIKAASRCAAHGIPILGVNLGRVGYLAEIEQNEMHLLERLCRGEYKTESRMMLDVSVLRDEAVVHKMQYALNEAVISNGAVSRMVDLSLACDGHFAGNFHADGVIIATPTGSTAYSMSAGGPIIDPALECICVTPVCAHSLSARPMLLSPKSTLTLENISVREDNTYLTVDGAENFKLLLGDVVTVARAPLDTRMIRLRDDSFYSVLQTKMGI